MAAEDLIAVVFPDQLACAENLSGEREIPDHPLVRQTLYDCLHEAMDVDGLVALLRGDGARRDRGARARSAAALRCWRRRSSMPGPMPTWTTRRWRSAARRRSPARRWLDADTAAEFGQLEPAAIDAVRSQARPAPENADELHDALMLLGVMRAEEARGLDGAMDELVRQRARRTAGGR